MNLSVDAYRLQANDECTGSREPAALNVRRGGYPFDHQRQPAQLKTLTRADVTGGFPAPRSSWFPDRAGELRRLPAKHFDPVAARSVAPADLLVGHAPDSKTVEQPASDLAVPLIDTHWSRILYCDIFKAGIDSSAPDRGGLIDHDLWSPASDVRTHPSRGKNKEIFVAANASSLDAGSHRIAFPIEAAAIVLGVLIAMSLAVASVVYVKAHDATAVAPGTHECMGAAIDFKCVEIWTSETLQHM